MYSSNYCFLNYTHLLEGGGGEASLLPAAVARERTEGVCGGGADRLATHEDILLLGNHCQYRHLSRIQFKFSDTTDFAQINTTNKRKFHNLEIWE